LGLTLAGTVAANDLVEAAKAKNVAHVVELLRAKADAKSATVDGTTALHWAAYNTDVAMADALLKAGADVNAVTDLGVPALWAAAQNGDIAMVERLLAAGANPNQALLSGETSLMVAARGGFADVIAKLLAKGANVNVHGTRGQTALMWAVSRHHANVAQVLIAGGADVHAKSEAWSEVMAVPPHGYLPYNKNVPHGAETALMFAARVGDLACAKLLVGAGANVNDADAWGVSAVTLAAHSGFTDVVLYLLDKGADPNRYANGFAALHEGIMRRDEGMVKALLEHGANPNLTLNTWTPTRRSSDDFNFDPALVGATPLWMAARFNEPAIMKLLLSKGADPKFVHTPSFMAEVGFGSELRTEKNTLLMAAVGMGRAGKAWVDLSAKAREAAALETTKLALSLGIDINATGTDGRTALDGARQLRMESVVKLLTDNGAKGAAVPAGGVRGAPRPAPAK
jgi:uncharacterized protein